MTTSVKMRPEDKGLLDRLQAEVTAKTGKKLPQQEILRRLVRFAAEHIDILMEEPLTSEEVEERLRRLDEIPEAFDVTVAHDAIDDIVYGD